MGNGSGMGVGDGRSPLYGLTAEHSVSADGDRRGVVVTERPLTSALLIMAGREKSQQVTAVVEKAFGVTLPLVPKIARGQDIDAIWAGPDQWILILESGRAVEWEAKLRDELSGIASIVEQTHARVQITMSGSRVRDALAKLVTLDLHPTVFGVDHAAMTVLAHIPIHVWRSPDVGGVPAFEISGPQSYARSLWHHIFVAAAEYGVETQLVAAQSA